MKAVEERVYQLTLTQDEAEVLCDTYAIVAALLPIGLPTLIRKLTVVSCLAMVRKAHVPRESLSGKMSALLAETHVHDRGNLGGK